MPAVAVGDVFENQGPVTFGGVTFAVLDGGFDGEDVHAVDFEARDVLPAFVVFGEGGGAVGGGAHAILVVCGVLAGSICMVVGGGGKEGCRTFAAEKYGEVPELGHVECFKDLALVAGAVSVKADGGVVVVLVLIGERNARTNRYLSADYTITAIEAFCKHVHGSTFPVGNTFSSAK